ncbi:unnamed protein product [Protopolystoma xenopodis]|uniref:Uncharacterized protein n=1 Tax=Protopolystoma xenopodis TaxID=117903 RepID=A0A448XG32_9PLAT|nr:unnamed protein product [Protopolystoma xenopodis]
MVKYTMLQLGIESGKGKPVLPNIAVINQFRITTTKTVRADCLLFSSIFSYPSIQYFGLFANLELLLPADANVFYAIARSPGQLGINSASSSQCAHHFGVPSSPSSSSSSASCSPMHLPSRPAYPPLQSANIRSRPAPSAGGVVNSLAWLGLLLGGVTKPTSIVASGWTSGGTCSSGFTSDVPTTIAETTDQFPVSQWLADLEEGAVVCLLRRSRQVDSSSRPTW